MISDPDTLGAGAKPRLHTPKAVTYHDQSHIINHDRSQPWAYGIQHKEILTPSNVRELVCFGGGISGAGTWMDADMLQLCTYGEGATRHWNSTGEPNNMHGQGLTFTEYKAHLSVWAVLASPLIQSADLRTVGQRHPECLELMLNPEILAGAPF